MQLRPERAYNDFDATTGSGGPWFGPLVQGPNGATHPEVHPIVMGFFEGAGMYEIWRFSDEPGAWRDRSGKFVPLKKLRSLGMPDMDAEIMERSMKDDASRAQELLAAAHRGEKPEIIETRGEYTLVKVASGFRVERLGVDLVGAPTSEKIARFIFEEIAQEVIDLDDMPLDAAMEAESAEDRA